MLKSWAKSFLRADRGVAAIEAAFIFPFMFLLYFSLQDITGLISYNRKMTAISGTVTDLVAQSKSTITRATITDIMRVSGLIAQPLPEDDVKVIVQGYYKNNGAVQLRWQVSNTATPSCTPTDTTDFLVLMANRNDLIVSTVCMNYRPYIGQLMGDSTLGSPSFLINKSIVSRPRDSTALRCVVATGSDELCSG